jgi:hypothetical protein
MPSVEMAHARTTASEPAMAAEEICTQFGGTKPKLVMVFGSRDRDHHALNRELRTRLPADTRLLGATTAGEVDRDGMHTGSVVAAALWGDFDVGIGLGKGLSRDAVSAGETAIKSAVHQLGARDDDLGSRHYVACVIDDGFRYRKEELLLGVTSLNPALVAVGGGAGDIEQDPAKQSALIHVDGEVVTDAAAVALFHTDAPWAALRSHWYAPSGQTLRITKIDATAKRAVEIDGLPAAKRSADLLGIGVDDLEYGKPNGFAARPTALRVGREYFIRAPLRALPDGTILFPNTLERDTQLEIVKLTDPAESTRRFFETEVPARVPSPRAMLLFHCFGRAYYAAMTGQSQALSESFRSAPPCAGLNVNFEIYCAFQLNSTLTSLTFGASPA